MKLLFALSLSVILVACATFRDSGTASNFSKNQRSPADESNKYSLETQIAKASKDIQGTFDKILNEELKKGKRVIRLGGDVLFYTIKNGAKYDKRELSRLANDPQRAMAGNVMGPNGGGSIIWANWSSYSHQPATDSRGNTLLHFVLSDPQLLAEWKGSSLSYLIAQTNLIVKNNNGETPLDIARSRSRELSPQTLENLESGTRLSNIRYKLASASGIHGAYPISKAEMDFLFESLRNGTVNFNRYELAGWVNHQARNGYVNGSPRRYDLFARDSKGNTLLHFVLSDPQILAEWGERAVSERAIQEGYEYSRNPLLHLINGSWDLLVKNNNGETPLDVAKSRGVPQGVLNILEEATRKERQKEIRKRSNQLHERVNQRKGGCYG